MGISLVAFEQLTSELKILVETNMFVYLYSKDRPSCVVVQGSRELCLLFATLTANMNSFIHRAL